MEFLSDIQSGGGILSHAEFLLILIIQAFPPALITPKPPDFELLCDQGVCLLGFFARCGGLGGVVCGVPMTPVVGAHSNLQAQ